MLGYCTLNVLLFCRDFTRMKALLDKGITDEARRLAAGMVVDEEKRKKILPTPSEGTAPTKKEEPAEPSDFDDLETRGAPKFK